MPQLTITDIFEECQKGIQGQGKLVKSLFKIYNSMDIDEFWTSFANHAKYPMIVYRHEPTVERTIEFMAKFSTSLLEADNNKEKGQEESESEEMHPFLERIFSFCLEHHNAREKAVRFRCCQLVNKLLNSMGEDAQIDDDLYDRIYECMLQRLRDKFPLVRVQAVLALSRLQDPHNPDCPVISAYLFLLGCDTNSDVRRAVLGVIAASTKTLIAIVERTRDVKDVVRRLAYQMISEKIHIRAFTIAQRVRLLHEGLNDRSEVVKDCCASRLLQAWLRLFEGNVLELLKALDVETSLETAQLALKKIFAKSPPEDLVQNFDLLNENLVLKIDELTVESSLYWRSLVEFLAAEGQYEELLEKVAPDGAVYADFMKTVLFHMEHEENIDIQLRNEFILQQLLAIADAIDLSDQVHRRAVQQLLRDMLMSEHIGYSLCTQLVALFTKLSTGSERQRVDALIEIISDIRMPISVVEQTLSAEQQRQLDLKLAAMRVSVNELRDELDACVARQDFARAAEIKASISDLDQSRKELLCQSQLPAQSQECRTEKNDSATLMKCLSISAEMLQQASLSGLTPSLHELINSLILPGVTNADPALRNVAVRCLGLCCFIDKQSSIKHLLLFMQVAQMDVEQVKVTALRVLFDILHTFGLDSFGVDTTVKELQQEEADIEDASSQSSEKLVGESTPDDENKEERNRANSILTVLISLLDSKSSEIRSVIAEGLAKLMICGRIISARLLSRLLLLWYNPVTEDDNQLRHCLGAFFPIYAYAGSENQLVVEEAFMLTLRTLFTAPASSPLAQVDVNNVADLLVQLTDSSHLINKQDYCCHDNIAVAVCNEILRDPKSFNLRAVCRILTLLQVNPNNYPALKQLYTLSQDLIKEVKDKQSQKAVEKFHKVIRALLIAAKQNPLIGTPGSLSTMRTQARTDQGASGAASDAPPEMAMDEGPGQEEGKRMEETQNETTVADHTMLIDPNNSRLTRKARRGKKMLHSINETPITERSARQRRSKRVSQAAVNDTASELNPSQESANTVPAKSESAGDEESERTTAEEEEGEEAFASPTPVRRSTRRARRNAKNAKQVDELNLDSDTQSDSQASSAAAAQPVRRTRNARKRTRGPLNEIRNEVQ